MLISILKKTLQLLSWVLKLPILITPELDGSFSNYTAAAIANAAIKGGINCD